MLKFSAAKVSVSDVFCDRLVFVIPYSGNEAEVLSEKLKKLVKVFSGWRVGSLRYKFSYRIWAIEDAFGTFMHISWDPRYPQHAFLRVELNPHKSDMLFFAALMSDLLPGGWSDIEKLAVINRVDAAVDILGATPSDLFAFYPKMQISKAYFKSGSLETLYFGGSDSERQVVIYDKARQLEECKDKSHPWDKFKKPDGKVTRVEVRLRSGINFSDLKAINNPFEPLTLKLNSPALSEDVIWQIIHLASNICGHQPLIQALPKSVKSKYLAIYDGLSSEWWSSMKVWAGWPLVADGLLPKIAQ